MNQFAHHSFEYYEIILMIIFRSIEEAKIESFYQIFSLSSFNRTHKNTCVIMVLCGSNTKVSHQ
jgi:hypothetical protein